MTLTKLTCKRFLMTSFLPSPFLEVFFLSPLNDVIRNYNLYDNLIGVYFGSNCIKCMCNDIVLKILSPKVTSETTPPSLFLIF